MLSGLPAGWTVPAQGSVSNRQFADLFPNHGKVQTFCLEPLDLEPLDLTISWSFEFSGDQEGYLRFQRSVGARAWII